LVPDAPLDQGLLASIEQAAIEAVREAGALLSQRFGGALEVSSKGDRDGKELVTDVDRASQRLIASLTVEKFPGHVLLGEEDAPKDMPPAADWVWAVDPIDGTTNFVNGLPVHAVSVGVLFRGRPVAGAIWVPWPSNSANGGVLHARSGGGAWFNGRRLAVKDAEGDGAPADGRLSGIPGGLRRAYRVGQPLRKGIGEPRMSGSTAYETAMVAAGVMQFTISGSSCHVWDYAASSLLVREAGGEVFMPSVKGGWTRLEGWGQPYSNEPATLTRLRDWSGPMIMAAPKTAAFLAANLELRRPSLWQRVRRAFAGSSKEPQR
jgi:myo-inositol-1(or 4)-monophosphatase